MLSPAKPLNLESMPTQKPSIVNSQLSIVRKTGFTLIELLIVISILGILVSIGFYSFENARLKSRDSRRIQDLGAIKSASVLYYQDNKKFPGATDQNYASNNSNDWIPNLAPNYIEKLPEDPLQSNTVSGSCTGKTNIYCYQLNSDGTFVLWAQLENVNNQEIWNKQNAKCTNNPQTAFGAATKFNFCLKSPSL